ADALRGGVGAAVPGLDLHADAGAGDLGDALLQPAVGGTGAAARHRAAALSDRTRHAGHRALPTAPRGDADEPARRPWRPRAGDGGGLLRLVRRVGLAELPLWRDHAGRVRSAVRAAVVAGSRTGVRQQPVPAARGRHGDARTRRGAGDAVPLAESALRL